MGWPLIVVGQALLASWLIGKTNLQSLLARVKALCSVCQFAALKLLSNALWRGHLIGANGRVLTGVGAP
jgi:hypothetical protein